MVGDVRKVILRAGGLIVELVGAVGQLAGGVAAVRAVQTAVSVGGDVLAAHVELDIVELSLAVRGPGVLQEVDEVACGQLDGIVNADGVGDVFLDDGDDDVDVILDLGLLAGAVLVQIAVDLEGQGDGVLAGLGNRVEADLVHVGHVSLALVGRGDLGAAIVQRALALGAGDGGGQDGVVEGDLVLLGVVIAIVLGIILEEALEVLLVEAHALACDNIVGDIIGLLVDRDNTIVSIRALVVGHDIKIALAVLVKIALGQGIESRTGVRISGAAQLFGVVSRSLAGVLGNDVVALVAIGDIHAVLVVAGGSAGGLGILRFISGLDGGNRNAECHSVAVAALAGTGVSGHVEREHADLTRSGFEDIVIAVTSGSLESTVGVRDRGVDLNALDGDELEHTVRITEQFAVGIGLVLAIFNGVEGHFMNFADESDFLFNLAAKVFGRDLNVGLTRANQLNSGSVTVFTCLRNGCNAGVIGCKRILYRRVIDRNTVILERCRDISGLSLIGHSQGDGVGFNGELAGILNGDRAVLSTSLNTVFEDFAMNRVGFANSQIRTGERLLISTILIAIAITDIPLISDVARAAGIGSRQGNRTIAQNLLGRSLITSNRRFQRKTCHRRVERILSRNGRHGIIAGNSCADGQFSGFRCVISCNNITGRLSLPRIRRILARNGIIGDRSVSTVDRAGAIIILDAGGLDCGRKGCIGIALNISDFNRSGCGLSFGLRGVTAARFLLGTFLGNSERAGDSSGTLSFCSHSSGTVIALFDSCNRRIRATPHIISRRYVIRRSSRSRSRFSFGTHVDGDGGGIIEFDAVSVIVSCPCRNDDQTQNHSQRQQ